MNRVISVKFLFEFTINALFLDIKHLERLLALKALFTYQHSKSSLVNFLNSLNFSSVWTIFLISRENLNSNYPVSSEHIQKPLSKSFIFLFIDFVFSLILFQSSIFTGWGFFCALHLHALVFVVMNSFYCLVNINSMFVFRFNLNFIVIGCLLFMLKASDML